MTQSVAPVASVTKPVISIRPFAVEDQEAVAKLFLQVITERVAIPSGEFEPHWREYAQKRVETDLADIRGVYVAPGGNFWVAVATDADGERIAGIVGLERKSETEGEVRTMFVSVEHHRLGIGRALMASLMGWARDHGFTRLFLTTPAWNKQSRGFYASLGFDYQPHSPPLAVFGGGVELAEFAMQL